MKQLLFVALLFILVGPLAGQTKNYSSGVGGVIKDNPEVLNQHRLRTTALAKVASLPDSVDLSAFAPAPMDQGAQESCVAFAVAGLIGLSENQEHGYSLSNQFSQSFLYNLVNFNGSGSKVGDNLSLVCEQGIPRLSEFPYYDTNYSAVPSLSVFKSALSQRGLSWSYFTGGDTLPGPIGGDPQAIPGYLGVNTARALLASGKSLVLVINLTTNNSEDTLRANNWIFSWASAGTGTPTLPHAVYVIGYDDLLKTKDGKGAFRIRMSSGPDHFDHGDLWVTYQAVGLWQMMECYTLEPRLNYKPELTVETDWNMQYLGDRFESGFKVNGQTQRQWILWWATSVPVQLLYKKLPNHLPIDLTDLSSKIGNAKSFTYFIKGAFRPSKFGEDHPKIIKLRVLDSLKGIDVTINANLIVTDSLFYAEWPITLTDVKDADVLPTEYSLSQNYPNPFNPTTEINFSLPKSGNVTLKVYDLLGREVATLVDEFLIVGAHNTKFDASNLASGIYLYSIQTSGFTATKKMILMK